MVKDVGAGVVISADSETEQMEVGMVVCVGRGSGRVVASVSIRKSLLAR